MKFGFGLLQAVIRRVAGVVGVVSRHKRLTVAVLVLLILVGPLLRGGGFEALALNAVGIGIVLLIVRRFARFGRRKRHEDR